MNLQMNWSDLYVFSDVICSSCLFCLAVEGQQKLQNILVLQVTHISQCYLNCFLLLLQLQGLRTLDMQYFDACFLSSGRGLTDTALVICLVFLQSILVFNKHCCYRDGNEDS